MDFVKKHFLSIFLVFILAFFFLSKVFWLSQPNYSIGDEKYYIEAAQKFKQGNFEANPEHPPLGKLLILVGINIFGENIAGTRIPALIFGTVSLLLLFLLSKELFNQKVATLAVLLLSLDPLWAAFSRLAMLDIFVSTFIISSAFIFWRYLKNPKISKAILLGVSLGLAVSVKWNAVFLLGPIFIFLTLQRDIYPKLKPKILNNFLIFAIAVFSYTLIYLFLLNLSFRDFIMAQYDMTRIHLSGIWPENKFTSPAWLWLFSKPLLLDAKDPNSALTSAGNPLVFWLWPATFLILAKEATRKLFQKRTELFFVLLIFLFLYLPWFFQIRPTFTFYILPAVPFICIGTAYLLLKIWEKNLWGKVIAGTYILISFVFFLFNLLKV